MLSIRKPSRVTKHPDPDVTYIVLYICDTSDGRRRKRSMLFQRWFQEYDHTDQFTVFFGCISDENTDNYVGIIVERANPKYQSVIDDFNETLEMFHANKP